MLLWHHRTLSVIDGCPAFDPMGPYVPSLLHYVDCSSIVLAEQGYRAFLGHWWLAGGLGGLIAINIAAIGYGMLLDSLPNIREIVFATLRIGIVVALATQWAAWQPLVFDVVTRTPDELAGLVLGTGGVSADDLISDRLQTFVTDVDSLIAVPEPAAPGGIEATSPLGESSTTSAAMTIGSRKSLTSAEHVLLFAALGGRIAMRIVAAILLAIGPLFVGFLLFDATRSLFLGWVRAVIAAVIGGLAVPLLIAIMLPIEEVQLAEIHAAIARNAGLGGLPDQMWLCSAVFAAATLAVLAGSFGLATGLEWPQHRHFSAIRKFVALPLARSPTADAVPSVTHPAPSVERGRADMLAERLRRDSPMISRTRLGDAIAARSVVAAAGSDMKRGAAPLGETGRRSGSRASRASLRRDGAN